jgi:hypothetical protein
VNGDGKNFEPGSGLTREQILSALTVLNEKLAQRGAAGELCLFGGAVMVLAFQARIATKDVDAIFQPTPLIRELALEIAEDLDLPEHWLNDGVRGFVSAKHEVTTGSLPQFSNLRIMMPTAEYLLAMKCLASRIGAVQGEADDTADIIQLIKHLALPNPNAVMDVVTAYYPTKQIPIKAQFLIESLFEEGRV